ncbi:hypothetical protein B0H13DRAFT_1587442, partial [Mycena leptocephala]
SANEGALVWDLLAQVQKTENRKVLFGKQVPQENTSKDHKITVYKRIGESLLPALYLTHPETVGKRCKGKAEEYAPPARFLSIVLTMHSLFKIYQEKAARLRVTGRGLGDPDAAEADDVSDNVGGPIQECGMAIFRPLPSPFADHGKGESCISTRSRLGESGSTCSRLGQSGRQPGWSGQCAEPRLESRRL